MKRNDCRKPRGSVYVNNGYWYLDVRLPGEDRRRKRPLRAPGAKAAAAAAAALRTFREMFGARPISELVHSDVVAVRDAMARSGRYCRTTVNRYVHVVTGRMLPWACDMGLVRPAVRVELSGAGAARPAEPRRVRRVN